MSVYNNNHHYYYSLSLGHHAAAYLFVIGSSAGQVSGVPPISQTSSETCENNQEHFGEAGSRGRDCGAPWPCSVPCAGALPQSWSQISTVPAVFSY